MRGIVVSVLIALGGGTSMPQNNSPATSTTGLVESIRYEMGPCIEPCPVYILIVRSNGHGTFEGKQHTAVRGVRDFTMSPTQYANFRARLEPYLGKEWGAKSCLPDAGWVDILWTAEGQSEWHLFVCGNGVIFEGLRKAPEALPQVLAMISRR